MSIFQNPEVVFALGAVRQAVYVAEAVKQQLAMRKLEKGDLSPVTVGDFAIQACIARQLAMTFPGTVLVGEESSEALRGPEAGEMRALVARFVAEVHAGADEAQVCDWVDEGAGAASGRFWTLDPIDGTKGYLRGGHYAIAFALIEDGEVRLGVLGCPSLDSGTLLVAARGAGSYAGALNSSPQEFRPVRVSDIAAPAEARVLRSFEAGHTNEDETGQIAERLGVAAAPVLMDSQAKYAVLASGGGDVLLRLLSPKQPDYKEKIWDQAAGSIVVEEAGGRVTDLRGHPLNFTRGIRLEDNTGICATNGPLHDAVLEAIAGVCRFP